MNSSDRINLFAVIIVLLCLAVCAMTYKEQIKWQSHKKEIATLKAELVKCQTK